RTTAGAYGVTYPTSDACKVVSRSLRHRRQRVRWGCMADRCQCRPGDRMATHHQRGYPHADPSAGSVGSSAEGDGVVTDDGAAAVTTEDVDWLLARLRSMVTASST